MNWRRTSASELNQQDRMEPVTRHLGPQNNHRHSVNSTSLWKCPVKHCMLAKSYILIIG